MEKGDAELRQITGYNIKRASSAVLAALVVVLEPFGLRRVTYSSLSIIVDQAGLRQADLAEALAIDRPNLVMIVSELEAAGLITRTRSTQDRRAYHLHPTDAGTQLSVAANAAVHAFDEMLGGDLTKTERQILNKALWKIECNAKFERVSDASRTLSLT